MAIDCICVMEVDGYSHYDLEAQENDKLRDVVLGKYSLTILRIDDEDVKRDMNNVLRKIESYIEDFEAKEGLVKEI